MCHVRRVSQVLLPFALVVVSTCGRGTQEWETGEIAGAQFRMRMPASWNRSLVVAAGGYSPSPISFSVDQDPGPFATALVGEGYAYAETGYSAGGVAISEAIADVRRLREHFVQRHGNPQRTFVVGESKGGLVALLLAESSSPDFDGALAISGLLSSPYAFFSRAFDLLGRFHASFPDVLPRPDAVPTTYRADEKTLKNVLAAMERDPGAAERLRVTASLRSNEELAELVVFHTEALGDLQRRCSGNGFRTSTEVGGPDGVGDGTFNPPLRVDPNAERCVRSLPGPTGRLVRPLLALDVAYDPVIPSWAAHEFADLVKQNGRNELFAREVVEGSGHLNVTADDRLRAFRSLVQWTSEGVHPATDGRR